MPRPTHITSFRLGDHICLFYNSLEEQISTAGPFVQQGLQRKERCFCVLPSETGAALLAWLHAEGVDGDDEIATGALIVVTPQAAYLANGKFDREQMIKLLDDNMHEALALGFTGFRGTGDLTWAAAETSCCSQMPEYEAMLDQYYPGKGSLGICMYDVRAFDPGHLKEIMRVHKLALTAPSSDTRAIRIRNGNAFGDVIFDRAAPSLFHYTAQRDDSGELLTIGQTTTLEDAMNAIRAELKQPRVS